MMNENRNDLILSGIHLELTPEIKTIVQEKVDKLFRHESHILRVRIELECNGHNSNTKEYIAKGHIEINGPPLIASESSEELLKSIDFLTQKLDRMLRRRSRLRKVKRKHPHEVDIPAQLPKVTDLSN